MKPLILGEAPSRRGRDYWRYPLSGDIGVRLATWAGLMGDDDEWAGPADYGRFYWPLREQFNLKNVIEQWPGAGRPGPGATFPRTEAKAGLIKLIDAGYLPQNQVIVCLGRRVLNLIVHQNLDFYRWVRFKQNGWQVVGIPHPSKLNQMYNHQEHVDAASKVLRGAIKRASKISV